MYPPANFELVQQRLNSQVHLEVTVWKVQLSQLSLAFLFFQSNLTYLILTVHAGSFSLHISLHTLQKIVAISNVTINITNMKYRVTECRFCCI